MPDQLDDTDQLTSTERRALDEWTPMAPPQGFADRVLAARAAPVRRRRWPFVAGALAAAAVAVVIVSGGHRGGAGELAASSGRTTLALADRGVAVAEPAAQLTWRVDASGAAEIDQRAGDVFYRVEHGGPFVIHTPEGDVRVTGTCLRVEVDAMKPTKQMFVSGAVGAALASAVIVTVYEGHVVAESRGTRTELTAGTRATLGDGSSIAVDPAGNPSMPTAAARVQQDQIVLLRARIAQLEQQLGTSPGSGRGRNGEDGEPWLHPSHDTLVAWAAECRIRYDDPGLDRFTPFTADDGRQLGVEPGELDAYNAAMADVAKQWHDLVRALYIEATGDTTGADTLSVEAMRHEIEEKSPHNEAEQLRKRLSAERAGLSTAPGDASKLSPLERLLRASMAAGDQGEAAVAKRLGAARAAALRGEGWGGRHEHSGCPK